MYKQYRDNDYEFYDVQNNHICPKCGHTSLSYFGTDTTIFVDNEQLGESIKLEIDKSSVKNCFKLVAGDNTRAVDKDIHVATILANLLIGSGYHLIVGNIHDIALHLAECLELLYGSIDIRLVDIPNDYTISTLLESHSTHYLSDTRCSSRYKNI